MEDKEQETQDQHSSDKNNHSERDLVIWFAKTILVIGFISTVVTISAMKIAVIHRYDGDSSIFGLLPGNFNYAFTSSFSTFVVGAVVLVLAYISAYVAQPKGSKEVACFVSVLSMFLVAFFKMMTWAQSA